MQRRSIRSHPGHRSRVDPGNLRKTDEQRLLTLQQMQEFVDECAPRVKRCVVRRHDSVQERCGSRGTGRRKRARIGFTVLRARFTRCRDGRQSIAHRIHPMRRGMHASGDRKALSSRWDSRHVSWLSRHHTSHECDPRSRENHAATAAAGTATDTAAACTDRCVRARYAAVP